MKIAVLICLLMAVFEPQDAVVQTGAFAEANRLGQPPELTSFCFCFQPRTAITLFAMTVSVKSGRLANIYSSYEKWE